MALAVIIDDELQKTKIVKDIDYPVTTIISIKNAVKITELLPFRVRFSTIGIPTSYSGVPAIPLQIIGINNYIL
jgi:hypothetical protein